VLIIVIVDCYINCIFGEFDKVLEVVFVAFILRQFWKGDKYILTLYLIQKCYYLDRKTSCFWNIKIILFYLIVVSFESKLFMKSWLMMDKNCIIEVNFDNKFGYNKISNLIILLKQLLCI
jgi:hypothetical protein